MEKDVKKNIIGNNIRKIREQNKISRNDLAKKIGVGSQMMQYIERGERKGIAEWVYQLPHALNCSYAELFGEKEYIKQSESLIKLNYFDEVKAQTNKSCYKYSEVNEKLYFDKDFLQKIKIVHSYENIDIIKALDDSMYPTIQNDDLVFVDRSDTNIKNGMIYIINEDSVLKIKRIRKIPTSSIIEVMSDNENKYLYPNYEFDTTGDKVKPTVCGKILSFTRNLI
jgi:phage repressor protein C with HTH and peptisase S24 domain